MQSAHFPRFCTGAPLHTRFRIGLLGGSFNPAHEGHLHLSREALRRLGLDAVWWLVAPQNPLKSGAGMADYETRLESAREAAAKERRIHVSDIERRLGTRYTVDTLRALQRRYPRARFVWLMGGDNLASFHRWKEWTRIFSLVPVAVFDRAPYSHTGLRARTALRFAGFRLSNNQLEDLPHTRPPAWGYALMRRNAASATAIRAAGGRK